MKAVSTLAMIMAFAAAPVLASQALAQEAPAAVAPAAPAAPAAPVKLAPEKDANGVYQVIRVTDSQMTCEQLASEINNLNATLKTQAEAQAKTANGSGAGKARGVAGGAASGALSGLGRGLLGRAVPGLGIVGSLAAVGASDAASTAVGGAIAGNGAKPAAGPATVTNEQQRFNRVNGLFGSKGC